MPKLITITDPALLRWYGFGKDGQRVPTYVACTIGFGKDGQRVPTYVACTIDLWLRWWADRYWSRKGARR
jgi:hypothetical protein